MDELLREYELKLVQLRDVMSRARGKQAKAYAEGCVDSVRAFIKDMKGSNND